MGDMLLGSQGRLKPQLQPLICPKVNLITKKAAQSSIYFYRVDALHTATVHISNGTE